MPREQINVQKLDSAGINANYTTIGADGVSFDNTGNVFIHVKALAATDLTIETPMVINEGLAVEDRVISLSLDEEVFIGPFSSKIYEQEDGSIYVDTTNADEADIAALRL